MVSKKHIKKGTGRHVFEGRLDAPLELIGPDSSQPTLQIILKNFNIFIFTKPVVYAQMETADIAHHFLVNYFRLGVYGRVTAGSEVWGSRRLVASSTEGRLRELVSRENAQSLLKGRWMLVLMILTVAELGGLLILLRRGVYVTNLFNYWNLIRVITT